MMQWLQAYIPRQCFTILPQPINRRLLELQGRFIVAVQVLSRFPGKSVDEYDRTTTLVAARPQRTTQSGCSTYDGLVVAWVTINTNGLARRDLPPI